MHLTSEPAGRNRSTPEIRFFPNRSCTAPFPTAVRSMTATFRLSTISFAQSSVRATLISKVKRRPVLSSSPDTALPRILPLEEAMPREVLDHSGWHIANVRTHLPWPVRAQSVRFAGQEVWVFPLLHNRQPSVAISTAESSAPEAAERVLMRFISSLAWVYREGILTSGIATSGQARPLGCSGWEMQPAPRTAFDLIGLPAPAEPRGQLALALMRDGWSINSPAYAFLSFYRAFEVAVQDPKARQRWFQEDRLSQLHRANVATHVALERLNFASAQALGQRLFKERRHPIAHGMNPPHVISPDDIATLRELQSEKEIMGAVASIAIQEMLNIQPRSSGRWLG